MSEAAYFYDEAGYLTTPTPAIATQHNTTPPMGVRGNQTTVNRWLNTTNSFISSHTNWYDTGEAYQAIDPLGHATTHSYDPAYVGAYATQTCSPQTGSVTHCVSGTYDFNTGVLTSLTNENATAQASGNTPGRRGAHQQLHLRLPVPHHLGAGAARSGQQRRPRADELSISPRPMLSPSPCSGPNRSPTR